MSAPSLHRHFSGNPLGRDFIVGDLHGCTDLLQAQLEQIQFDPASDRLFSVGDLADCGPDSLGCLRLLRQPWYHAVRGNHENTLLDYGLSQTAPARFTGFSPREFVRDGGGWALSLSASEREELLEDLLPRVEQLPYVMSVGEGNTRFNVAHTELMDGYANEFAAWAPLARQGKELPERHVLTDAEINDETIKPMTSTITTGRRLISEVKEDKTTRITTPCGDLATSHAPWHRGLSLTYVGHTPMTRMVLHKSHVWVDRGAYARRESTRLLVLEHRQVLSWLSLE